MFQTLVTSVLFLALLSPLAQTQETVRTSGQSLGGTWWITLHRPNGTSSPVLVTFHPDGTATASPSTKAENPHHGVWLRTGDRRFLQTMMMFTFNDRGEFAGINKVRITAQLDDGSEKISGTAEIVVMDGNGVEIRTISGVRYEGNRINVETQRAATP
jgi:hypothetical protein